VTSPIGRVLDVGTGTGRMLQLLADRADRAVGLDSSHSMLSVARANLERAGVALGTAPGRRAQPTARWRQLRPRRHPPGPPLPRRSCPGDLRSRTLVAPGGRLLVVDFAPHRHDFLRAAAHRRLGFTHEQLADWFDHSGFDCPTIIDVDPPAGDDGLTVTVWLATNRTPPVA
jgi:SAM-dependent methyltransferase